MVFSKDPPVWFGEARIDWQGRPAAASVPPMLAGVKVTLSEEVVRTTERAAGAVGRAADGLGTSWEPLARQLLRSEAVASSTVEDVRAPLEEVVAAEIAPSVGGPAAWVADNLAAVSAAAGAARELPLTVDQLMGWHRLLMRHQAPETGGALRDRAVWVGGLSPFDAAYVGPPHGLVPSLLDDLVALANSEELDVVTHAALLHAQFECIHPFADGSGRVGRALVGWVLVRRLGVRVPPPVSVLVARDLGGYVSGLDCYRRGSLDTWVRWFATTLEQAAKAGASLAADIESLQARWRARAHEGRAVRTGALVWSVFDLLPEHPVVSAAIVAQRFRVSAETSRQALLRLEQLGVVSPSSVRVSAPGRPVRWWVAHELVEVISRWA